MWDYEQSKINPLVHFVESPERRIAEVYGRNGPDSESNASCISAVPDFIKACESVVLWAKTSGNHGGNPYCKEFVKLARIALAKARRIDVDLV